MGGDDGGGPTGVIDQALRAELLAMAAEDRRVRAELAAYGSLFDGYHPRMAEVHRRNAARLTKILDQHGWPGPSLVGEDGAAAAWLVLQHAIGDPPLMRRGLELLSRLAPGGVDPARLAMLEDRKRLRGPSAAVRHPVRLGRDRPARPAADRGHRARRRDELRRSVGLGPLEELRWTPLARPKIDDSSLLSR